MTKTELYNTVIAEIENIKMSKPAMEALLTVIDTHLKPRTSGGSSKHPAKMDEAGNIVEAYCRYEEAYLPAEEMVISGGKSKGYSRKAIARWNKGQRLIKKLTDSYMELEDPMSSEAKEIKTTIAKLKEDSLNPELHQNGSLQEILDEVEASLKKEEA